MYPPCTIGLTGYARRLGGHFALATSHVNVTAEAAVVEVPATAMFPPEPHVRPLPEPSNTSVIAPPFSRPVGTVMVARAVVPVKCAQDCPSAGAMVAPVNGADNALKFSGLTLVVTRVAGTKFGKSLGPPMTT